MRKLSRKFAIPWYKTHMYINHSLTYLLLLIRASRHFIILPIKNEPTEILILYDLILTTNDKTLIVNFENYLSL